jgi:Uma2 family endonuclease
VKIHINKKENDVMGVLDYLPHYTYSDYILWKGNWELFEGIPVAMSPAPEITHQAIAALFVTQLNNQIDTNDCRKCFAIGEEDYKLCDDIVLRPDVALICNEPNDAYITKAPEIIVEVISKSTAKNDENYKYSKYESEGVNYYIIAYPDKLTAAVYQLIDGLYQKQGDFSHESYLFDQTRCKLTIDFNKIFKRFRK